MAATTSSPATNQAPITADETALLHEGGRRARWGNLGLWPTSGCTDYASACAALARRVGLAAGLRPHDRVLSVACGAGEELVLWWAEFGVQDTLGIDHAATAPQHGPGWTLQPGRGDDLLSLGLAPAQFDAVVCVDAAYHLQRAAFLQGAFTLLRPGGRLAYTELVCGPGRLGSALLRAGGRACGLAPGAPVTEIEHRQSLHEAGYAGIQVEHLGDAVLGGFARFAQLQRRRLGARAWSEAWARPAVTGWLIGPARAAGLGYVLLSAQRPSMAAATSAAERTALSSKGTPACA